MGARMVAGGEASPRAQPPVGAAAETAGERVVQTRLGESTAEGLDSAAAGEFSLTFAPVGAKRPPACAGQSRLALTLSVRPRRTERPTPRRRLSATITQGLPQTSGRFGALPDWNSNDLRASRAGGLPKSAADCGKNPPLVLVRRDTTPIKAVIRPFHLFVLADGVFVREDEKLTG